jgi:hypothetical protein
MDKPEKYTFEDWYSGKYWYEEESDLNEIGIYALSGEDGDFETMKPFLNRPMFIHAAGEMETEDLMKVQAEQTRLFKLIFDEQVEAGMKLRLSDLEPHWSDKVVIQARLNTLEKLILEDGRGEILFNIRRGRLPRLDNLTGPDCRKLNGSASAREEYLRSRTESTLSQYIEVALTEAERALIRQSTGQSITKQEIYKRYADYLDKDMKPKEAFPLIVSWLTVENGYTDEQVKAHFNVTLEYDSFTRSARNNINPSTKTARGKKR